MTSRLASRYTRRGLKEKERLGLVMLIPFIDLVYTGFIFYIWASLHRLIIIMSILLLNTMLGTAQKEKGIQYNEQIYKSN